MSCEYLLLNGARINCQDAEGKTPLYLATELGTLMILSLCFFRGRGERIFHNLTKIYVPYIYIQDTLHKYVYFLNIVLINTLKMKAE